MSDDTGTSQLLTMMTEMTGAIRKLVDNQERLTSEQQHAAKAIGELGLIVKNHAEVLRYSQSAIETVWRQLGLPFDPPPGPQAN